jgi:hypothetical protein
MNTAPRHLLRLMVLLALVGTGLISAPRRAQASTIICAFQSVPRGYVITGHTQSASCGTSYFGTNALVIQRPYDGIIVCLESPIPGTYVITGYTRSASCGTSYLETNASILRGLCGCRLYE